MPLPQEVVPFRCSDKRLNEQWTRSRARDLWNFPSPRFDEVYLIHEDHSDDPDAPGTTEYDDTDCTPPLMNEVPDLSFWNQICAEDDPSEPPIKRLIILDDLEMKGRERLRNLQTLFRYVSSHKGFSLCLSYQNFFGWSR